ncbi:MAG: hypothetical protein Q4E43_03365 [Akkermansia sp.]|nr:hypothetical protein [Akkermansia sp.]
MIYGIKQPGIGTTLVIIKNEDGYQLYSECFGGTPDQVQVLGSGDSVTILADCPGNHQGKLITQVDKTNVKVTPVNY